MEGASERKRVSGAPSQKVNWTSSGDFPNWPIRVGRGRRRGRLEAKAFHLARSLLPPKMRHVFDGQKEERKTGTTETGENAVDPRSESRKMRNEEKLVQLRFR